MAAKLHAKTLDLCTVSVTVSRKRLVDGVFAPCLALPLGEGNSPPTTSLARGLADDNVDGGWLDRRVAVSYVSDDDTSCARH